MSRTSAACWPARWRLPGRLAVACGNDGQFARLCEVLGLPALALDAKFSTNPARVAHRDELVAALEETLRTHP